MRRAAWASRGGQAVRNRRESIRRGSAFRAALLPLLSRRHGAWEWPLPQMQSPAAAARGPDPARQCFGKPVTALIRCGGVSGWRNPDPEPAARRAARFPIPIRRPRFRAAESPSDRASGRRSRYTGRSRHQERGTTDRADHPRRAVARHRADPGPYPLRGIHPAASPLAAARTGPVPGASPVGEESARKVRGVAAARTRGPAGRDRTHAAARSAMAGGARPAAGGGAVCRGKP